VTMRGSALWVLLIGVGVAAFSSPLRAQEVPDVPPEVERYFGDEMRARVIQARAYEKTRHHGLTLAAGIIPNDDLFVNLPLGMRYDYFFTETIGVEVRGAWVFRAKSRLFKKFPTAADQRKVLPKYEELVWNGGAQFLWIPIYGKFALLGTGLTHIEAGLLAGVGAIGTRGHLLVETGPTTIREDTSSSVKVCGDVGLLLNIYLSRFFALRFEYVQFFYKSGGDNLFLPAEVSIGATWFIIPLDVAL